MGSQFPKVKAYAGSLPEGTYGIEFETDIPPDLGHAPGKTTWSPPTPGVFQIDDETVAISVRITKIKTTEGDL